ncbi:MAG: endonuclease/exonuclease/phosphatase family protein [Bacteroidota bacterium]
MEIKIATFNVENLFARYRFRDNFDPASSTGFGINNQAFSLYDDDSKKITGKVIREVHPDILCLQEVENLEVLERFNTTYLGGLGYKYRMVIDSHDPRHIDVAVLSTFPIKSVMTYRHDRNNANTAWLFSRDCLEVAFDCNGHELIVYNNHFKSMIRTRAETRDRRREQVDRVADIITDKWGPNYDKNIVVLGDFNDYTGAETALTNLVSHEGLVDVIHESTIPANEKYTHYWAGGNQYSQIDFILLGKELYELNKETDPEIFRNGLPYRADRYNGPRIVDVGDNRPKASDHCLVSMKMRLL